jgi:thiamine transporter
MLIALGTAISFISEAIPFLNLPFGGTVTLASLLPLVLISWMYGIRWGLGSAFVYSLLQMAVGFKTVSALFLPDSDSYMGACFAILILLLDYVFAFTSVGLSGIFRAHLSKQWAIVLGSVLGLSLCYLFHVISGAVFYGEWAEWFFTESAAKDLSISSWVMKNFSGAKLATVYSIVYNGLYMLPEIVVTALCGYGVAKIPTIKKG